MMLISRRMKVEDIDRVFEIETNSFTTPWSKESFHQELIENTLAEYYVLELDDYIIGYGGMWLIIDEIHITNIAIDTPFRGHGYSKTLMYALIEFGAANGYHHMTLEVRVSNDVAIALYEKIGFTGVGKRPKYYIDTGEDALVMWKEIK
ncbi:ribosomal protein S18-alanine N-acetyltransferase [Fusibacter bizertensis]|uniref:[Ribosomal protein bS18]-alanine N-acetyltransferase n=2 Tax=Fusibacter bizertensis TaxID=1488331 RepID=A0ABT6NDY1_9FIRM|nr:ribosomal protein S18-alanine N-acetyltransferase [Fusibacter bizertensis]